MSESQNARAASLSHLHSGKLSKGDPLSTPIVMSSVFHLPGDPAGARQYGRFDNPTWEAVEAAFAHLEDAEAIVFPSGIWYGKLCPAFTPGGTLIWSTICFGCGCSCVRVC